MLNVWRFISVLLCALALSLTSAHVLELPQKMQYDAQLYSAVNTTMYRYFAFVGAPYSMGAILAAGILAFWVRRDRPVFRWTLAATLFLILWFASWLTLVAPVNGRIAKAVASAPGTVPALWMQLRPRWEYGHAIGFALELIGFGCLVISLLIAIPREADHKREKLRTGG